MYIPLQCHADWTNLQSKNSIFVLLIQLTKKLKVNFLLCFWRWIKQVSMQVSPVSPEGVWQNNTQYWVKMLLKFACDFLYSDHLLLIRTRRITNQPREVILSLKCLKRWLSDCAQCWCSLIPSTVGSLGPTI